MRALAVVAVLLAMKALIVATILRALVGPVDMDAIDAHMRLLIIEFDGLPS